VHKQLWFIMKYQEREKETIDQKRLT
jgi:hypothetical protein